MWLTSHKCFVPATAEDAEEAGRFCFRVGFLEAPGSVEATGFSFGCFLVAEGLATCFDCFSIFLGLLTILEWVSENSKRNMQWSLAAAI